MVGEVYDCSQYYSILRGDFHYNTYLQHLHYFCYHYSILKEFIFMLIKMRVLDFHSWTQ